MLKYVIVLGMAVVCVEMKYSLKMFRSDDPTFGHLNNCAHDVKNFTFMWKPKEVVPHGRISVDLEFIPPYDWSKGMGTVAVFLQEDPKAMIFRYEKDLECGMIKPYMPSVSCPFKAGKFIHLQYADKLPSLPSGKYLVKADIKNDKGQEILCATGEIDIAE